MKDVRVYGTENIREFARRYAVSRKPLARFLEITQAAAWTSFVAVKQSFRAVDYAPKTGTLISDIGGNKYRLTARIDCDEQALFIQAVMTHDQYNREDL